MKGMHGKGGKGKGNMSVTAKAPQATPGMKAGRGVTPKAP